MTGVAAVSAALVVLLRGRSWQAPRSVPGTTALRAPLAVAAVVVFVAVGAEAALPVPLLGLGSAALWATQVEVRRRRDHRDREHRCRVCMETCDGLAADLRAGLPPIAALAAAAREWPECRPVLDAARLGGDVPAAWCDLARRPGAAGLRSVAAAWVLAHRSGAGLADAVELAARVMREDRSTARVVEAELASARATAKLLAVLPLAILLLGRGAGGDPFGFLLRTTPGLVCLGLGLVLMWAGLSWIERIARSVQG